MNERKQKNHEKGITLIALVITIVVLLILAGITIQALSGENGLLKRATEAKEENVKGVEKEAISIAYTGVLTKNNMEAVASGTTAQGVTAGDLEEELHKNGHEDATATGAGTITVTFSKSGNSYTVEANTGKIEEVQENDNSNGNKISKILSPILSNGSPGIALLENGKVVNLVSDGYTEATWTELQIGEEISGINGVKKSYELDLEYGQICHIIDNSGQVWEWIIADAYITAPEKIEGLRGITDVYDGATCMIAKDSSGNLWSWGYNNYGQLGIGSTENATTPQQINGLSGITDVYNGGDCVIAKDSSGNLWSWGNNNYGQLGIGSTENATTPQQINGLSGIADVYFGGDYVIAKDSSGNLWSWGYNGSGRLGIGSTEDATTPQQINGLSGIADVYVGGNYVIAKDSSGNLWSWGYNGDGQLGIGSTEKATTPQQINGLSGIIDVSFYCDPYTSVIAKDSSGNLWSWGYNGDGRLGIESTEITITTPQQLERLSGITDVYVGKHYIILKDGNRDLWACGFNNWNGTNEYTKTLIKLNDLENMPFYGKKIEKLYVQAGMPSYYFIKTNDEKWYIYNTGTDEPI